MERNMQHNKTSFWLIFTVVLFICLLAFFGTFLLWTWVTGHMVVINVWISALLCAGVALITSLAIWLSE